MNFNYSEEIYIILQNSAEFCTHITMMHELQRFCTNLWNSNKTNEFLIEFHKSKHQKKFKELCKNVMKKNYGFLVYIICKKSL